MRIQQHVCISSSLQYNWTSVPFYQSSFHLITFTFPFHLLKQTKIILELKGKTHKDFLLFPPFEKQHFTFYFSTLLRIFSVFTKNIKWWKHSRKVVSESLHNNIKDWYRINKKEMIIFFINMLFKFRMSRGKNLQISCL